MTTAINDSTMSAPRRRRFRRQSNVLGAKSRIELRPRDLDMIAEIARHRFMNTEQMCRLFACNCPRVERMGMRGGKPAPVMVKQHRANCACTCGAENRKREHASGCLALLKKDKHVGSRLRELYQAGYLDRPITQLQLRVENGVIKKGSVPLVYCVTAAGLALIGAERQAALGHGKMSWVNKINEGTRVFLEHTLAVADVSVDIDVAMRGHTRLQRVSDSDLLSVMAPTRSHAVRPWTLHVDYKGEELAVVCDLAFSITDRRSPKRWNFLVEVDRGHMPIERADLSRTSIVRKLIAYAKAHVDGAYKAFGWSGCRVLILTTSQARVQSCVTAAKERFGDDPVGRLFLFGTLDATRDLSQAVFVTVDGKRVPLLA